MTTISAHSILRTRNSARGGAHVLSTLLLTYPRFIHAEFMTHRVMSRNAASSRAIPFERQLDAMLANPAVPLHWGAHQKGMQANRELEEPERLKAEMTWLDAMNAAAAHATMMHRLGAHKQITNRIIEPFTHIKVLVSATEWDNFLELRDHPAAEPHMQLLAQAIKHELDHAPIQTLDPGHWHLPFVDYSPDDDADLLDGLIPLCVARCASTSYKTVDNFDMTMEKATELHDQFVHSRPQHASPLEHAALLDDTYFSGTGDGLWKHGSEHANFVGFRQYRHMV